MGSRRRSWWRLGLLAAVGLSVGLAIADSPPSNGIEGGALSFFTGTPGERTSTTISPVAVPGTSDQAFTIKIEREEGPTAVLQVWDNGQWRQAVSGTYLGEGPVALRLSFSRAMDKTATEQALASLGQLRWESDRIVCLTVATPSAFLRVDASRARDDRGLPVSHLEWCFYAGQRPRLCRVDPRTGEEQTIALVPFDIYHATVNRDGTALLALAYEDRKHVVRGWVIDLATGEGRRLEGDFVPIIRGGSDTLLEWVGPDAFIHANPALGVDVEGEPDAFSAVALSDEETSFRILTTSGSTLASGTMPAARLRSVSPDGRWVAGFRPVAAVGPNTISSDLVLFELATGQAARHESVVVTEVGAYDASGPFAKAVPAWSPDGSRVAIVNDGTKGWPHRILVLDPGTGEVEASVGLADAHPSTGAFSWSPDGRFWAMGTSLIDVAPPYRVWPIRGDVKATVHWSHDGAWFARADDPTITWEFCCDNWGEVLLYRVGQSGPGEPESLGEGHPCGWDDQGRLYIIRWEAWQDRMPWWWASRQA